MFSTRVVTAITFGVVLLGCLWLGGLAWWLFVAGSTLIGTYEYLRLWRKVGGAISPALAGIAYLASLAWALAVLLLADAGAAASLLPQDLIAGPGGSYAGVLGAAVLLAALATLVLTYPASTATGALGAVAGAFYVGWAFSHLLLLREPSGAEGIWRTLLVFGGVWATDVLAYFVGSAIGRHKLKPSLSPGKSVEGAIGGLLGGLLAVWFIGGILGLPASLRLVLGLAAGVLGQVGDLAESALKRQAGVKDSGALLPGHGGILDRFDSTLFAAPLVYYLLAFWAWKGAGM